MGQAVNSTQAASGETKAGERGNVSTSHAVCAARKWSYTGANPPPQIPVLRPESPAPRTGPAFGEKHDRAEEGTLGLWGAPWCHLTGVLTRKDTEGPSHKDTGKRWPCVHAGERLRRRPPRRHLISGSPPPGPQGITFLRGSPSRVYAVRRLQDTDTDLSPERKLPHCIHRQGCAADRRTRRGSSPPAASSRRVGSPHTAHHSL